MYPIQASTSQTEVLGFENDKREARTNVIIESCNNVTDLANFCVTPLFRLRTSRGV